MKQFKVNVCQEDGIKLICEFLSKLGISNTEPIKLPDYQFNRIIEFEINGQKYYIEWFINQCTLIIGDKKSGARIPFRWMYQDTTFPLIGGNRSLGFSQDRTETTSILDLEFPFSVLRIPINTY